MAEETTIELKRAALNHYFQNLNTPQQQAVFHVNGPVLVLAGDSLWRWLGTGKRIHYKRRCSILKRLYCGQAASRFRTSLQHPCCAAHSAVAHPCNYFYQ